MAKSLLDLPRELRDIIYEYALTEKGGLIVQNWPTMYLNAAGAKYGTPPNQLKLTCRQIYAETVGLSLRYNELIFGGHYGIRLFDKFTRTYCTSAHFRRVKSILIFQKSDRMTLHDLEEVDAIGKAYPTLSIEVRLEWLTEYESFGTWCYDGSNIHFALRGMYPDFFVAAGLRARNWLRKDGFSLDSSNVQVFPRGFDEAKLRVAASKSDMMYIDDCIAQFQEWFQEGF